MTYAQRKSHHAQAEAILHKDITDGAKIRKAAKRKARQTAGGFWNDKGDGLDGIRHGALDVFEGLGYSIAEMNARAIKHGA